MIAIKERPILFSAPMVRAILEGRKTVTRRAIKDQPHIDASGNFCVGGSNYGQDGYGKPVIKHFVNNCCPFGKPGDRLWVREAFACGLCTDQPYAYRATHAPEDLEAGWHDPIKWKPSIHMPRGACRILLEITDVRVEQLQDITEEQAKAEGVRLYTDHAELGDWWHVEGIETYSADPRKSFELLWSSVGGDWQANPWVWVVEFKRVTP